jgi:hypothetical protein
MHICIRIYAYIPRYASLNENARQLEIELPLLLQRFESMDHPSSSSSSGQQPHSQHGIHKLSELNWIALNLMLY